MKKTAISAILLLALILTACGNAAAAQWQEQYDLGVRYLSEGDFENAIVAFQAAIEIDPKRAQAYVGVAQAYIGLGDEENAIEWLQKGIETADDTGEIAAMLTELGAEVPEAAAPEGGSTDATQGEGGAAAADKDDSWDGDETLAAMMRTGVNPALLREGDYTALGVPFFESATVENLRAAAKAAGLDIHDRRDYDENDAGFDAFKDDAVAYHVLTNGATFVAEDGTETVAKLSFIMERSWSEEYGTSVGMYGIALGDSFETALTKLGFSNAKEIADYCNSHLEDERGSTGIGMGEMRIILEYDIGEGADAETGATTSGSHLAIDIFTDESLEKWIYLRFSDGRLVYICMEKY